MSGTSLYDAPRLYDLLCPLLTDEDPELGFWRRACASGPRVLELACGTGRVALPLAQGGLTVTGLDLAPAMLAFAAARAATLGVDVRWVEADMTRFDLGERFDAVLIALNSLLLLHTRDALAGALGCVRAHLAPGGVFALSVLSPDPRTLARRPHHRLPLLAAPVHDPVADRPLTVDETVDYDHATQTTRGRLHFSYPDAPDFFVGDANLRMLWPRELDDLLHHQGFEVVRCEGDFEGTPFGSASLWQNIVCRAR